MSLPERRRLFVMGLCLTATLAVAAVSGDEREVSAKSPVLPEKSAPATKELRLALSRVSRELPDAVEADIFPVRTWQPAPPPPAQVLAAVDAKPTTPMLPFLYAGQLHDLQSGKLIIYLTSGETVYASSVGDIIDGNYRIDAITDRHIIFVYLPTTVRQPLGIPGN